MGFLRKRHPLNLFVGYFLQQPFVCVCFQDSTFIMVIIGGSLRWLLHAMCPVSWHHKKGMAHAPWPAFTHTLFICVLVPATGTHHKYNLRCWPLFVGRVLLSSLPANVCIWVLCSGNHKYLPIGGDAIIDPGFNRNYKIRQPSWLTFRMWNTFFFCLFVSWWSLCMFYQTTAGQIHHMDAPCLSSP